MGANESHGGNYSDWAVSDKEHGPLGQIDAAADLGLDKRVVNKAIKVWGRRGYRRTTVLLKDRDSFRDRLATCPEQGGGLRPVSSILPGLEAFTDGPLKDQKALLPKKPRPTDTGSGLTVQSRHHYTRMKQVTELARLGEAENQDMGFMARMLTLCSLPRTDPGDRAQYKRQNGPYRLIMTAGGDNKLPSGNLPRLLLAWVCTEAVRTQDKRLVLGQSLSAFMQQLGINSDSGGSRGDRTRLRNQIDRLFNCHIGMIYETREGRKASTGGRFAAKTMLWWDYKQPDQQTLWRSWIELGDELFEKIVTHPMPIDMGILKTLRRSSLGLDLYMWLSYKTFTLYSQNRKPERLAWDQLYRQFGSDPALAGDKTTVQNFRKDALREIAKLKLCWPTLDVRTTTGALEVRACQPSITPKALKA
ncbi:MAG: replication protein RepA [Bryobacteraceae bacterium]